MKFALLIRLLVIISVCFVTAQPAFADKDLAELINKGNSDFALGKYDKAMSIYEDGLKASPKEAILFYNKANVHYRLEEYEEALVYYDFAIKNNPAKILLKNIYFNKGNTLFKFAEKKAVDAGQEINKLKGVLAEYELSFDMYRKSIDLDREISIAEGKDIHLAGTYAKQNWALARERWTRIWEKIRELEKKNLQLEDAIKNLLSAQTDLLPGLEKFYLASFSEDTLKFSLKTLVQYHLDNQQDIADMRDLSAKEVEKIAAEIANIKNAQQQATTSPGNQPPLVPEDHNPELAKLEEEQRNIEQVQIAVDKATELEEWILDNLKRLKPIEAWKNSRQLIDLLQDLHEYLNKGDLLKKTYTGIIQELLAADALLKEATTLDFPEEKGVLTKEDILAIIKIFVELKDGNGEVSFDEFAEIMLQASDEHLNLSQVGPSMTVQQ